MATLPFSYATLAQTRQVLANRLYDSNMVFWTSAELTLYIQEALSTWNALTQYWRGDFVFPLSSETSEGWGEGGWGEGGWGGGNTGSTSWYDLTQQANTLRPYTVTDQALYTLMEYQLLEPATGVRWTGTSMFTINDLINAVQRRRDEMLSVTGCTIALSTQLATPGVVRNYLTDSVLDVRRIAYFPNPASPTDSAAVPSVLWPEDAWSFQAFENGYSTAPPGTPNYYALSTQPPLSFDTDLGPNRASAYELLTVNAGPALSTAAATILNIPTDYAWVLKWGALADLLSKESEAKDETRAAYCNQRYQQGLKLLMNSPALLQFRINNVPLWIDSVRAADEYQTDWEAQTPGAPQNVFVAGLNLIAISPSPDTNIYSAMATVVMNAPLPVNDTDPVQISRDVYDVIIDYSQHLALFKCGGAEFTQTKELYNRMVRMAATINAKLEEMGCFQQEIYGLSQREELMNPRLTKSVKAGLPGGSDNE